MAMRSAVLTILLMLPGLALADSEWYNARESLQKAQVGTASPQLQPAVKITLPERFRRDPSRVERLKCYPDLAETLRLIIICEEKERAHVAK